MEDNADAREILKMLLEMAGHTVITAADGVTAVSLAVESSPEVVLLDIGLPRLDGFEVAERLRKRLGSTVRIVALSGYGDASARARARDAGFDAHLVKPVSPERLARILATV